MGYRSTSGARIQTTIDRIEITHDNLTGRGGLSLFARYLRQIDLFPHLDRLFGTVRKNGKGVSVREMFKQMICFFVDGTSRHLSYFDHLRSGADGYGAVIEVSEEQLASSHSVKRFLRSFWWPRIYLFRRLLIKLFLWRLQTARPEVIVLGLDTSVFDNDDALQRHGVQPTYKKVKGFQPLLLTWNRFIIDAVFRGGKKHSNSGDSASEMVTHVVDEIRKQYRIDVPILIRFDAGFFDQDLFEVLEQKGIGYTCTGKLYQDIKEFAGNVDPAQWRHHHNGNQEWGFFEFGDRRGNWACFRRAFYLKPRYEDRQQLLEFARPETVLYTNLGMGGQIDEQLRKCRVEAFLEPEKIIEFQHHRGADELVFRCVKEFSDEKLPCKRFNMNAVWFYTMLLSFFLFESFKEDVTDGVVPVSAYPSTFRRILIDFAAKIVHHSGKIVLKVTQAVHTRLNLEILWQRCLAPPKFVWL